MRITSRSAAVLATAALTVSSAVVLAAPSGAEPAVPVAPVAAGDAPSISIDPASITAASPDLRIDVASPAALTDVTVSATATGGARVAGGTRSIGVVDGTASVSLGAAVPTGMGAITATLRGTTAGGVATVARTTTYVDTVDGTPIASRSGQDLRLSAIELRRQRGLVSAATARRQRAAVLGSAASTHTESVDAACATVCVSGLVRWTDHQGKRHVVPNAPVQVYAQQPGSDELLASTSTDTAGRYAASAEPAGRDVYVRVLAAGPGFAIRDRNTGQQHIDSAPVSAPADGTDVAVNLTASNDETMDNNTAFSVQNALVVGNRFVVAMNGKRYPTVKVEFPNLDGGSYFDGGTDTLYLDAGDRWDWDPVLHEFGHYVMARLGIDDNPGGTHSPGENLSDVTGSKSVGIRLAWGEAWPTFFSLSLQQYEDAAALNIRNVGDSRYQDTEDTELTIDPERGETLGEDDEVTDLAVLWDLFDARNDGLDRVHRGARWVWNRLKGSGATTLSKAYAILAPGTTTNDDTVNCIMSQYRVAPRIAGGQARTGSASPTLRWLAGNGGSHPNRRFVVEYRATSTQKLLYRSPAQGTRSFRASTANWKAAARAARNRVTITVVGSQRDRPVTGPYRSCAQNWKVTA